MVVHTHNLQSSAMGGDAKIEKPSPKIFSKVRSVFRPKSRGPADNRNETSSAATPVSSSTNTVAGPLAATTSPQVHPVVAPPSSDSLKALVPNESESAIHPPAESLQAARQQTPFIAPADAFGDRQRTEERYKAAAKQLEDALGIRGTKWQSFDIPKVTLDLSKNDPIPELRRQFHSTLEARKDLVKYRGLWEQGKNIVERTFTATSPFAKTFLAIAVQGAAVYSSLVELSLTYRFPY